ncbi:Ubiquitin-like domain-containing protein [Caenorhabditis elegans]|uniref:Ubiquitin-like domain-containing protein n=1 Tax=Caenorhabditis elegans TaxID=6239 RepID=A0A679L8R2_CAEEL|nr:Uncharacterized protein CELE_H04J21.4 [Caenorhabditis elegans]CAA9991433.1 Uncharacterized protein CELE_H04J21.4 [Caenorhabditis elegans]
MSNNRRGIVKNNMRFVHIKFFGTLEVLHSHVEENEKLGRLDKRISEKIGVDAKFIRVTYNGRPIDPMDTPYSLGLSHTANFHVDILKNC